METIIAIVLAGGAGIRAGGRDKGLLAWHGKPLIEHALEGLARAGVTEIIISANRNLDRYAHYGHRVVSDAVPGHAGPLAGIAAGLSAARTQRVLTIPVDAPVWPATLADGLAAALDAGSALCAVAHDGAARQPLFALYARACASAANAALARGEGAVWRFQDGIGAVEVRFDRAGDAFANINAPVGPA